MLGLQDLPPEVTSLESADGTTLGSLAGLSLAEIEKTALLQTLRLSKGNKARAARYLGISEKSIYNKMKRLGIS